jgi:hypothetical protein
MVIIRGKVAMLTFYAHLFFVPKIPDPDFIHPVSRLSDSTTAPKDEGKIFFLNFFGSHNYPNNCH